MISFEIVYSFVTPNISSGLRIKPESYLLMALLFAEKLDKSILKKQSTYCLVRKIDQIHYLLLIFVQLICLFIIYTNIIIYYFIILQDF